MEAALTNPLCAGGGVHGPRPASADVVTIPSGSGAVDFLWNGPGFAYTFEDRLLFRKVRRFLTVQNTGTQSRGIFHIHIFSAPDIRLGSSCRTLSSPTGSATTDKQREPSHVDDNTWHLDDWRNVRPLLLSDPVPPPQTATFRRYVDNLDQGSLESNSTFCRSSPLRRIAPGARALPDHGGKKRNSSKHRILRVEAGTEMARPLYYSQRYLRISHASSSFLSSTHRA